MGKRLTIVSTASHLAFNPTPTTVKLRCGQTDMSRATWTFFAGEPFIGCPGCLTWIRQQIQTSAVVAPATPPAQASSEEGGRGPEGDTLTIADWRARALAAEALINTPEVVDFAKAVQLEAAHQRARWGAVGDAGKTDGDWFWLIGYLASKALFNPGDGVDVADERKQLHRIITVAAAAANWHAAKLGLTDMRPGIELPAGEVDGG